MTDVYFGELPKTRAELEQAKVSEWFHSVLEQLQQKPGEWGRVWRRDTHDKFKRTTALAELDCINEYRRAAIYDPTLWKVSAQLKFDIVPGGGDEIWMAAWPPEIPKRAEQGFTYQKKGRRWTWR